MITGVHTLVYADDAEAARAFFREVLEWPFVDAHGGWLIFRTGPSELGVHPTRTEHEGQGYESSLHHEISLVCEDIEGTVAALSAKGAEFAGPVSDQGFGRTVMLKVPGAGDMMLYEPRHPLAFDL
ncbi:MAG: VOC family protein [Actinobacteria bacterium]|nr:VOC family protein [Actinomycetota bacterium]